MGPDAAEGVVAGWRLEIAAERDRLPAYARMPESHGLPGHHPMAGGLHAH
jgi:hypothetical protein